MSLIPKQLTRATIGVLLAAVLVATVVTGSGAQTSAPYVKVFVDNQPVYFDQSPMIASGRVLVPLRGVFERLGAVVAWDPGTQTVLAQRGGTSVQLRIGAPQAMIDGQPTYMDVPPMLVGGRTLVPLRFVSQALGAQVDWNAANATVAISSQGAAGVPPTQNYPQSYPVPTTPAPATTITGTIVQVNSGQISVQSGNGVYTYQVTPLTTISRINQLNGAGGSVSLGNIRPGDLVQVTADQNGIAQSIQATYSEVTGQIAALTSNVIVLQNGNSYRLSPSVQVVQNGSVVGTNALQVGQFVMLRINPQNNDVWGITIGQQSNTGTGITSVHVTPASGTLVPGNVITVTANGPAHGVATFNIGGLRSSLPMTEQPGQPGTYTGSYTVQPGDNVQNAPVTVQVASGGQVYTGNAPVGLSINAGGNRPYPAGAAPTITSPVNGTSVGIPFTVSGQAASGTRVKVTANYSGSVLFFNVNGTLGTQTVTTDQNGNWQASFTNNPTVRGGTTLTITAVSVDANGNSISPTSTVTATLQ
jgi:hypothetical protein